MEVATETPEELTETTENEEVSPDPIIQKEVVCDDGTTTSQVQTVNAEDSLSVTTTQEMLNNMEIDSPKAPESAEEFPNEMLHQQK